MKNNLSIAMDFAGIPAARLAEKMGVTLPYISQLTTGQRKLGRRPTRKRWMFLPHGSPEKLRACRYTIRSSTKRSSARSSGRRRFRIMGCSTTFTWTRAGT